jgi:hypothetical protein
MSDGGNDLEETSMKNLVLGSLLALSLLTPGPAGAANSQQQKMKDCNAQATAKQLTGTERKSFMAQCLKAGSGTQLTAQQQKMKDCNAQATQQHMSGNDRKTFMSQCLSGTN